jgi:hypothetical protein
MAARLVLALLMSICCASAIAAPPQLYRQAAHESPVRGDPDDLLLLAGYGFANNDTVVYRAIANTTGDPDPPDRLPVQSGWDLGVAPVVSTANVPYSLTIRLPSFLRPDQSYELWTVTARGEWSQPVKINDVRPLWLSPAYIYESKMPGSLPRELKIIGRNLRPSPGGTTSVQLVGPEHFTGQAILDPASPSSVSDYVLRLALPRHLRPGRYRVVTSRDGMSWVKVEGPSLEVRADPSAAASFSVSDPQFGGCRPDDGVDDTACIIRAISAAARAGGGTVTFGSGTWDLVHADSAGHAANSGIVVPQGVSLQGAGSDLTFINRHPEGSAKATIPAFTLSSRTAVAGFTFRDLQVYKPDDRAGPFLQLGDDWSTVASNPAVPSNEAAVKEVAIIRNVFDKTMVAIASGGLPIERLIIAFNTFGAYHAALELNGDKYNVNQPYRIDDSVIDFNTFKPGSLLDQARKTGTIATELGAGDRLDFSHNVADGSSADYLYSPEDPKGWRAAFFWSMNNNIERALVSENSATCTGDKIGDGEAIAFDNNTNTFPLKSAAVTIRATSESVTVRGPLAARQHSRDVPVERYYVGHWIQIVSGPGLGQVRKIAGYTTDPATRLTTLRIAPDWDVAPIPGRTRISIGREFWQLYALGNSVDNRRPLCQKSNRSRSAAGQIVLWAQSADSVIAGNSQYDSDGIFVQQSYAVPEHPCPDCTMEGFFHFFLDIHNNLIEGKYDWDSDCSSSGITAGVAAAPWDVGAPPTVGFGITIAHNTIKHADAQHSGGIAQLDTWLTGPEPHHWPLSDNLLIHHNVISDIQGTRAASKCGSNHARVGISFPDAPIAWRTVLYANECRDVSTPIGPGGVDTITVCPSSTSNSCECPRSAQ